MEEKAESKTMANLSPEIYYNSELNETEKSLLHLLKLRIFAPEHLKTYRSLIRRGYINAIPKHCRVLGKHVFMYHDTPRSIYMN